MSAATPIDTGRKSLAAKRKPKQADVKTLSIELCSAAAEGEEFVAPTEFRMFRAGMNESHKGVFKFTDASATRVLEKAAQYGNEFSIDYGHGMFAMFAADPSEAGKAAGWFKPAVRQGELWATEVKWTKPALSKLENREYRYISPAFDADGAGEIQALWNVALTNIPAIFNLDPLVASVGDVAGQPEVDEESNDMNKAWLILLGLPETASESEFLSALQRYMAQHAELLQLTSKASAPEALAVVRAWKVAADSVPAMHQELSQLKERAETEKRESLIAEGKKRGVVPPAYEPVLKTLSMTQLEEFLKVAQPIHQGGKTKEPTTETQHVVSLSQSETEVARLMGVDPKRYAEAKARRGGVPAEQVLSGK